MSERAMFVCSDRTLATASLVNSIDLDNHCIRVQMFQNFLTTIYQHRHLTERVVCSWPTSATLCWFSQSWGNPTNSPLPSTCTPLTGSWRTWSCRSRSASTSPPLPRPPLSHNSNSRVVRTSGRRINNWAGLNRRESRPQGNWFWPRRDDGTGSSNQVGLPCRRPRPRPGDTATSGACLTCNQGISKSQATQHLIVSDVFNHLLQRMFLFRRRLRGNVHLEFHECEQ